MAKKDHSIKNMIQLSFKEEVGNAISHGIMALLREFDTSDLLYLTYTL
jgi:hypothetical protein